MDTDIKIQIAREIDFYQLYKISNDENIYMIFLNNESFESATDSFAPETSYKNPKLDDYSTERDKLLFLLTAALSVKRYFPVYDYDKLKKFRNGQISYSIALLSILEGGTIKYENEYFKRYEEIIYRCELNISENILAYLNSIMIVRYDVKYAVYIEILERYIASIHRFIEYSINEDHNQTHTIESFIELKNKEEVIRAIDDATDEKVGFNSSRKINYNMYVANTNTLAEINPNGKLDFYKNELYRLVKISEENILAQMWICVLDYCDYRDDKFICKLLDIKTVSLSLITFFYYDYYLPITHLRGLIFEIESEKTTNLTDRKDIIAILQKYICCNIDRIEQILDGDFSKEKLSRNDCNFKNSDAFIEVLMPLIECGAIPTLCKKGKTPPRGTIIRRWILDNFDLYSGDTIKNSISKYNNRGKKY